LHHFLHQHIHHLFLLYDKISIFFLLSLLSFLASMCIFNSCPPSFPNKDGRPIKDKSLESEHFKTFTKASALLKSLISNKENVREYIKQMSNIASKLKVLKLRMSKDLHIHLILISHPSQFGHCNIYYSYKKEKWYFNECISYYVQEEKKLK